MRIIRLKKGTYSPWITEWPIGVVTDEPAFSGVKYLDFNGKHAYDNGIMYRRRQPHRRFFVFLFHDEGRLWLNETNWIGFST